MPNGAELLLQLTPCILMLPLHILTTAWLFHCSLFAHWGGAYWCILYHFLINHELAISIILIPESEFFRKTKCKKNKFKWPDHREWTNPKCTCSSNARLHSCLLAQYCWVLLDVISGCTYFFCFFHFAGFYSRAVLDEKTLGDRRTKERP